MNKNNTDSAPPPIPVGPPNFPPLKPDRDDKANALIKDFNAERAAAAGADPFSGFDALGLNDTGDENNTDLYDELNGLKPTGDQTIPIKSPSDLQPAFDKAIGTHVVAIAGIMSLLSGRMNTSNDILGGTPKMYAGVNGEITAVGMTTPKKWVYRLVDENARNVKNHKSLTDTTTAGDMEAAKKMYTDILGLATKSFDKIKTHEYRDSLGDYIPKMDGVRVGSRFQLLLKYTPGVTINGTGYIRYGNTDTDIKSFSIKENKISMPDGGSTTVLKLINNLIGDGKIDFGVAGGKLSTKKRRMSSKKGGRNNSASRKQNKKGGAKARRSQKAGKRMR
jgi:hypothetical protein